MKKSTFSKIAGLSLALAPLSAFATDTVFTKLTAFINQGIVLLLAVATIVFMWGVIQYVIAGGDEKKTSAAKTYMLYGIIGLVMMVAAWGVVRLVTDTLGVSTTETVQTVSF